MSDLTEKPSAENEARCPCGCGAPADVTAAADRGIARYAAVDDHDFIGVAGHPDDDECTYRSDGTDATYCGRPAVEHDHHPNCYQSTGDIPDDLPDDLCDCRVLRTIGAAARVTPPADATQEAPR